MSRRWIVGALLAAALIPVVACSSDDNKDSGSAATSAAGTAAAAATTSDAATAPAAAATSAATAPAAAATSAATAPAAGAAAASSPQTMEVKAGDFFYEPANLSLRTGAITLTLNNGGERPHTLYVRKVGGADLAKTDRVEPGKTATIQLTLTEPGTYELYCNLPGHADRGQKGTLTVTAV